VIEIDGESHSQKLEQDQLRQQKLESLGLSFLRFYDQDVKNNLDGLLKSIELWVEEFESKQQL
jgi:very-short-patch-repair endonuclease